MYDGRLGVAYGHLARVHLCRSRLLSRPRMSAFEIQGVRLSASSPSGTIFPVVSAYTNYEVHFHEFSVHDLLAPNDFLFIDKNVDDILGTVPFGFKKCFTADENHKNIFSTIELIDELVACNFTKANKLLVVGGGITQDVGSLCAALFKRGISWEFVPTTLLSMCDSCIGSKNGVNHRDAKNQVGVFFPPSKVHIDVRFLQTLGDEHIASGMGEILKLYTIGNLPFNTTLGITHTLHQALLVKRAIIEYDEFEKTIRASLNYGHSFGHVIEVLSEYNIPHGTAVVLGMMAINKLYNIDNPDFMQNCKQLLKHVDKTDLITIADSNFTQVLLKDKKVNNNSISLIVTDAGKTRFVKEVVDEAFIHKVCGIIHHLLDD